MEDKKVGSLVVVGAGIKSISHLTIETQSYMRNCDKVLYSLNEPIIEQWVLVNSKHAESLAHFEEINLSRQQFYSKISEYIIVEVKKNQNICALLYGHPSLFSTPALEAAKILKDEGYFAKILPAICAEDCLFADLMIDPGQYGRQSFDATDLLIRQRKIDNSNHVVLWQVGLIGSFGHISKHNNVKGISILIDFLKNFYSEEHHVINYEASLYPQIEAKIESSTIKNLSSLDFSSLSTLYIPPISFPPIQSSILTKLN